MYTSTNFRTKKAMREAVERGDTVRVYQPGGIFPGTANGVDVVEGPHYPEPHRWYAQVEIRDYVVVKVLR